MRCMAYRTCPWRYVTNSMWGFASHTYSSTLSNKPSREFVTPLPFGGRISIGYEQTTPSYDHPGRKWVMSSVEPLSQGGKTSHQKQTFFSGGNSCVHSTSHNLFFSGKDYSLPQDVFMDPQNWNSNGFQYSWPGSAFIRLNIVATHAVGKTIFWRPEKNDNNYE